MLRMLVLLCLFWGVEEAPAQTVTVPKTLAVTPGRLAPLEIRSDGAQTRYWSEGDAFDTLREYDPDPKVIRLRVLCPVEGTYRLCAICTKGDQLSDVACCTITAGTPAPGPGPSPGPSPGPDPFSEAASPIRVLVVLETADAGKLPKEQSAALLSTDVRSYLNSHCVLEADGKTHAWRIWDKDVNPSQEAVYWQKAFARPRKSLPWLVVSNGRQWSEGALPKDKDALLTLLRKYGGQ